MIPSFFQYLLEASLCLIIFFFLYRICFARLTHFNWMRAYLLASILLSCVLPFIDISIQTLLSAFSSKLVDSSPLSLVTYEWLNLNNISASADKQSITSSFLWIIFLLALLYVVGIMYKCWVLLKSLYKIKKLIQAHPKVKEDQHILIYLQEYSSVFSFLNYIFIGKGIEGLPTLELEKIKAHEQVHVQQKHSLDLLLLELIGIVFWFNPVIKYIKKSLDDVHEFIADERVSGKGEQQKAYAHLLIKLACSEKLMPLTTTFSNKQIHNRITMLMKTRTLAQKKFFFLLLLPLMASLMFLLSCIDEGRDDLQSIAQESSSQPPSNENALENGKRIASIRWEGNAVYSDEKLNEVFGLKPGDVYDNELINSRLNYNPELDDVSSLYMDNGYLFFNINIQEHQTEDGATNLIFEVYEGDQIKTENIIIKGNSSISKDEILSLLPIKSGEWFSRTDLIASQKAIAGMGNFDPDQVNINPIPHPEKGTVDIEFVLTEIKAEN